MADRYWCVHYFTRSNSRVTGLPEPRLWLIRCAAACLAESRSRAFALWRFLRLVFHSLLATLGNLATEVLPPLLSDELSR